MHFPDAEDSQSHRTLRQSAPEMVDAFGAFDQAVFGTESALETKTKELIAIAVAATTQCPYCMDAHVGAAKKADATESEVAEAVMVASALRAGGALTHGWLALKQYDRA